MLSPHWLLEGAFYMSYLISILSQIENRCKMVLILRFDLILLVVAGASRLHADDYTKAQMQYTTGLKA
jgi:hypothetical protein